MEKPLLIFVDTNIAIQEAHFFRKKGGMELRRLLETSNTRLVVPEVLRKEYLNHFLVVGLGAIDTSKKDLSKLETLCGHKLTGLLPNEDSLREQAVSIINELAPLITTVADDDSLLVAAGRRTMENRAPCSKTDHGFKDCLIWESILRVADGADVWLVTRDKAFFVDEKSDTLAHAILDDAKKYGIEVKGFNGADAGTGKGSERAKEGPVLYRLVKDLSARLGTTPPASMLFEPADHPLRISAVPAFHADAPLRLEEAPTTTGPSAATPPTAESEELRTRLSDSRTQFWAQESTVLGFIAYLNGASKKQLYELLAQVGIEGPTAEVIFGRLVLAGLVQDTGHVLLPKPGRESALAAELVEPQVIKLLRATN